MRLLMFSLSLKFNNIVQAISSEKRFLFLTRCQKNSYVRKKLNLVIDQYQRQGSHSKIMMV
jgi:predicted GIY-YIG superfamily endonuclease